MVSHLRVAGTTRKAARYQIQEMILDAGNRSFDQQRVERGAFQEQEMEQFVMTISSCQGAFAIRMLTRLL